MCEANKYIFVLFTNHQNELRLFYLTNLIFLYLDKIKSLNTVMRNHAIVRIKTR